MSLCPFPETYLILGGIPGDGTLPTERELPAALSSQRSSLDLAEFGVMLCSSPSQFQERSPQG